MFTHATVWLESAYPDFGSFLHALEWATRLRLPLHCVRVPGVAESSAARPPFFASARREWWPALHLSGHSDECTLESCAELCRLNGVEWITREWPDSPPLDGCLNVVGRFLPDPVRDPLLRCVGQGDYFFLMCGPEWVPLRRVLVLNDARYPDQAYLRSAGRLCAAVDAAAAVLTTAATEAGAVRGQRFARQTLQAVGRTADFDFVAGCDPNTAIHVEATCRRCSHVFVAGRTVAPRRRWGLGGCHSLATYVSRSLALVVLPEQSVDAASGFITGRRPQAIEINHDRN